MRRAVVVLALLLTACGSSAKTAATTTTTAPTTTTDDTIGAYCRVMERTEAILVKYRDSIEPIAFQERLKAEVERSAGAPAELEEAWIKVHDGGDRYYAEQIQDWTQKHCGFLPDIRLTG